MRRIAFLIALQAVSLVAARPAWACTCMPPPPPLAIAARSALVFEGTVSALSSDANYLYAEVTVLRRWKAPDVKALVIATPVLGGAACGLEYRVGQTWLFYTQSDCGTQVASLCTYAKPIANAAADIVALGTPLPPGEDLPDGGVRDGGAMADAGVCRDAGAPRLDFASPPANPDLLGIADLAAAPSDLAATSPDASMRNDSDGGTTSCSCAVGARHPGTPPGIVLVVVALLGLRLTRRAFSFRPPLG